MRKQGDGSIFQRKDGRWEGRIVIGYNEKGNPKTKSIFAPTKGECEEKLKEVTGGVKSRCIPFEEEHLSDTCVCCGKPAKHMVYWGKQY